MKIYLTVLFVSVYVRAHMCNLVCVPVCTCVFAHTCAVYRYLWRLIEGLTSLGPGLEVIVIQQILVPGTSGVASAANR